MKRNFYATPFFLLALTFLASCGSDDPEPLKAEVQGALLAGSKGSTKSWKLTGATVKFNSQPTVTQDMDECQLDDIFTFSNNAEQTYQLRGGALKCGQYDDDLLEDGTWAFTLDGVMVIILSNKLSISGLFNYNNLPFPCKVIALTESALTLEMEIIDGIDVILFTFTFVKV